MAIWIEATRVAELPSGEIEYEFGFIDHAFGRIAVNPSTKAVRISAVFDESRVAGGLERVMRVLQSKIDMGEYPEVVEYKV